LQTVDGVLTSDSDALLYGAKKVYRKLKMDVSWIFLTRSTIKSRYIKLYTPPANNINNHPLLVLHVNEDYDASFLSKKITAFQDISNYHWRK